jgi:hypothetical protein
MFIRTLGGGLDANADAFGVELTDTSDRTGEGLV